MMKALSWFIGIIGIIILAGGSAIYFFDIDPAEIIAKNEDAAGQAAIGGPFTLVDHKGRTVTEQDFRGRYMLVYFGYTFCPDVCPTTLSTIAEAMEILGEKADQIAPVFITVDPHRDTVEQLAAYVPFFDPRLVALTGTEDQIAEATQSFKVYYAKVEEDPDDPESYLMDHSAQTYLMGPDGKFLTFFNHGADAQSMAEGLRRYL